MSAPASPPAQAAQAAKTPPATAPSGNPRFVLHPETDPFDYVAKRNVSKPTNVIESMAHMVKGCLGGGIMGVHVAYMKAGLWTSLICTIIFGFYITYCVHIIVHSAQVLYKRLHVTDLSYPDVAEASLQVGPFPKMRKFSKLFRYAVDVIICIDLFGSCCVYEIMIARSIVQLIKTAKGEAITDEHGNAIHEDMTQVRIFVVVILIPILLICMIRSLKYLAPFSIVANSFIVLTVFATVYYSQQATQTLKPLSEMPAFGTWPGFFEFAGVVVFSMEGVGVSLPIENNMKYPNRFPIALVGGMTIVVGFVCLVGFFGYWGWGNSCKAPVTLNFTTATFPSVLKGLMAFMIYVTFALNYWAPFNLCWFYIAKKYDPSKHWIWERVYRTIIILCITIIAIAFPQITSLMGLLGGFCLSNMGFIFPALIETLVIWEKPGLGPFKWKLIKNIIIGCLGIILFISSTFFNAKELFFAKNVS